MSHNSEWGQELLSHMDSAYNLARWLTKDEQLAKDVSHDAFVRAFRYQGEVTNTKAWFLTVVRNTAYTSMKKQIPLMSDGQIDALANEADESSHLENEVLNRADIELVHKALGMISDEYREIFILREVEELSYEELAQVLNCPMGTVMSRLSRAKQKIVTAVQELEKAPRGKNI